MRPTAERDNRRWFGLGALGALVIATIFATIGDGVEATSADVLPGFVIDHFHTLAWVLLAVAFGLAAFVGRWTRASGWIALGGLASYATFVTTLLMTD
jgi:hypothetical protein